MLIAFESRQKSFSSVDKNRRSRFREATRHRKAHQIQAIEQLPQDVETRGVSD